MAKAPTKLLGLADLAELLGKSAQNIQNLYRRQGLPPPDYEVRGRPAWKRSTLERAGTLTPPPAR